MDNASQHLLLIRLLIAVWLFGTAAAALATPDTPGRHAAQQTTAQKPRYFVNVNTADADILCNLDGVGPVKAAAIIEYRNQHGPFKTIDELVNVKGIGARFIEKNRSRIALR